MTNRRVSVTVDADLSPYNRGVLSGVDNTRRWVRELESADSRLSALVQTGMALGPVIAPLGAAAVGPLAGLTTQLGFAVAAGGTALLTFQGIGDALDALNEYQIAPTDKNLEKLNEKLDAVGPAGEVFVRQLQELRPVLQDLQDIGGENMFPGLTDGIDSTLTQLPRFEDVIATIARTLGDLAADAGKDLASPEWSEFFEYLDREAGPVLEDTGRSLGNMIEGVTNLIMALDPLSDDFNSGLLEMTQGFVEWSDNLDSSRGFQSFVAYVQESGPQAMDTLGAIAEALIEFVEAAAPVGDVVLPVLEVLADALAMVADSPAGPVIVGAAAAVGTLGRSLALLKAVGLRGEGDSLLAKVFDVEKVKAGASSIKDVTAASAVLRTEQEKLAAAGVKARDAQFAFIPTEDKRKAVREYATAQQRVANAAEQVATAEKARSAAMRTSAVQIGKNAAALGGLALMSTGAGDSLGVTNTASMAMMGMLGGPWGVAVGAGVGLLMDFASAGDLAAGMQEELTATVRAAGLDFEAQNAALEAGRERLAAYNDNLSILAKAWEGADFAFTGDSNLDEVIAQQREAEEQADDLRTAYGVVARAMGEDFTDSLGRSVVPSLQDLTRAAEAARPAMDALGISAEDLADMSPEELHDAAQAIADWTRHADSAEGRTEAVARSFRMLDDQMVDTVTSAEMVKNSLDALLGPGLNLSAANDAWVKSLRDLKGELSANSRTLRGNSDAAIQNRGAIRDRVSAIQDVLVAEANAGASSKELAARLRNQREALIKAGEAAGISKDQMRDYLKQLGLTPKLVKTLIKTEAEGAFTVLDGIKYRLDNLRDKTIYIRTVELRTGPGGQGNGYDPSARGNIFPTVRSYAWGDVADRHQPEIAGPGVTRVWREPETQGESYIPHANDNRRPRAKRILEDTASMFGGQVLWFATGGTTEDKKKVRREFESVSSGPDPAWIRRWTQQQLVATDAMLDAAIAQQQSAQRQLMAAEVAEKSAEEQKAAAERNLEAAESQLEATRQQRDAFAQQVSGNFQSDVFGSGFNAAIRGLNKDTAGASGFEGLLRQLEGLGLDGAAYAALAASGDTSTARGMLARGAEGVNLFETSYANREAALGSLGGYAADNQFAAVIAQQEAAVAAAAAADTAALAALDQASAQVAYLGSTVEALSVNVGAFQDQMGQLAEAVANAGGNWVINETVNARETGREVSRQWRARGR